MDLKTNEIKKKKKEQVQKIRWRVFFCEKQEKTRDRGEKKKRREMDKIKEMDRRKRDQEKKKKSEKQKYR